MELKTFFLETISKSKTVMLKHSQVLKLRLRNSAEQNDKKAHTNTDEYTSSTAPFLSPCSTSKRE